MTELQIKRKRTAEFLECEIYRTQLRQFWYGDLQDGFKGLPYKTIDATHGQSVFMHGAKRNAEVFVTILTVRPTQKQKIRNNHSLHSTRGSIF